MLVRSFTAQDMKQAMKMAREQLGENAVMLSTDSNNNGDVVVTFALEHPDDRPLFESDERPLGDFFRDTIPPHREAAERESVIAPPKPMLREKPVNKTPEKKPVISKPELVTKPAPVTKEPVIVKPASKTSLKTNGKHSSATLTSSLPATLIEAIRETLVYHAVPDAIMQKMMKAAKALILPKDVNIDTLENALASTLELCFHFKPLEFETENLRIILVGPPGMGKTFTAAKIAASIVVDNRPVTVISTDSTRAAGVDQLSAFTKILGVDLLIANNRHELRDMLADIDRDTSVIIDSAGCNPYDFAELKSLGEFATIHDAEPILVCCAGTDAAEAAEIATVFSFLGIERILISRSDCARRFGSVLSAASAGDYAFCHVTSSPKVMGDLQSLDATALSKLLTHYQRERTAS